MLLFIVRKCFTLLIPATDFYSEFEAAAHLYLARKRLVNPVNYSYAQIRRDSIKVKLERIELLQHSVQLLNNRIGIEDLTEEEIDEAIDISLDDEDDEGPNTDENQIVGENQNYTEEIRNATPFNRLLSTPAASNVSANLSVEPCSSQTARERDDREHLSSVVVVHGKRRNIQNILTFYLN